MGLRRDRELCVLRVLPKEEGAVGASIESTEVCMEINLEGSF